MLWNTGTVEGEEQRTPSIIDGSRCAVHEACDWGERIPSGHQPPTRSPPLPHSVPNTVTRPSLEMPSGPHLPSRGAQT